MVLLRCIIRLFILTWFIVIIYGGCTYKMSLKKLITLPNKIIRMITCPKPRGSSQPLYEQLKILKLSDINKYLISRFIFRYCNEQLLSLFDYFFSRNMRNHDFHEHDTRISGHFHIISVKSDCGETGIRYWGAVIWNTILYHGINHESSKQYLWNYWKIFCIIYHNLMSIANTKCKHFII